MDQKTSPGSPYEQQRQTAKALDETVHAQLAQANMGLSPVSMALAAADWAMHLALSPGRQMVLGQRALALAQQAWLASVQPAAGEDGQPLPDKDARFREESWQQWPFNALKEGFKASDAWWREAAQVDGMTRHHQHMVEFFTRQAFDALSPSNWPATNAEALQRARETGGQSLAHGYQNFTEDLKKQQAAAPDGPQALEPLTYAVGEDVAITPGKVVFRNHLIELIQYMPTTAKVYPEPLLIVPSCIMKYYILDLSPANSMVRYLVGQGYTVFIVSWRNPDASDRDLGMQDYLRLGVMEAMAAIKERTKAPRIHALGYCLGGTFLAMVAAALGHKSRGAKARGKAAAREQAAFPPHMPELASVTLLAAQTDFSEPGEMGVFIDDDQIQALRQEMDRKGYFSGKAMAGSFQFLNSRDLVWSRSTRRYLLGQDEVDFDLMSWNADLTRLPARMHSEYLSSLFLNNALATGQYRVGGVGVALMDIQAPMLVVGTTRDHVSPWRSVYKIHLQTDTHLTFILAAGGHNAGIVSEPGRARRSYQIAATADGHGWTGPDEWEANAPVREGSWWEAMDAWLKARSGKPVAPPAMDPAHTLCDAPGEYVMVRYAD